VVNPVNVRTRVTDRTAITTLARSAEAGHLAMRVAATFPAEHAPDAHRLLDRGGGRRRIILQF
jgi:NADPH2:quinone reductase